MAGNPIAIRGELRSGELTMRLSLLPDGLALRSRYSTLVCHFHNVEAPVLWDLGSGMDLIQSAPALGAPLRITITIYGVRREDRALEPVFRNWGQPDDGFPLAPASPA